MSSRFRALNGTVALAVVATLAIASATPEKPTGSVTSAAASDDRSAVPTLKLEVVDAITGKPTPARFSLTIDGAVYYPEKLNSHGLRFVSIHESKQQTYVVTYARGTGVVEVELPLGSRSVQVAVAKGFEYLAESTTRKIAGNEVAVEISLRRWTNLPKTGWIAADEHVHYDRLDPAGDKDWLDMLAGDDLAAAHFMVLKGGKVPGIWAKQYAYGKQGEAFDGERLIRSGEEYRDSAQGHINLLGVEKIIQPIPTGGLGSPPVRDNYPPLLDVFQQTRRLGGLGGVAHGASLGRHPTAIVDTVLGGVDFFEIGNAHLYATELWYQLMNCGYVLPPAAGTDLPNFPFRDEWQPFLGSMRMYVNTAGKRDFESWKRAVVAGKVFVTSGPIVSFAVNDIGPGGVVHLPDAGGVVTIEAELASPIGLNSFELIRMGQPLPADQPDPGPLKLRATLAADGAKVALKSATIEGRAVSATATGSFDSSPAVPEFDVDVTIANLDLNAYLPAPIEFLTGLALRHGQELKSRNSDIFATSLKAANSFFKRHDNLFAWSPPEAGVLSFPRWLGPGGTKELSDRLIEEVSIALAPSLCFDAGDNHFRVGLCRRSFPEALERLDDFCTTKLWAKTAGRILLRHRFPVNCFVGAKRRLGWTRRLH